MAILLTSGAALLGAMIGSYFYLRFTSPEWPQGGIEAPKIVLPIVMGAVLVASTLPLAAAAAAAKRGARAAAWWLIAGALVVQAGYLTVQIVEYVSDLQTFGPDTNAYGSIYFTLIGAHHAHVVVGILLDLWLLVRLAGGLTPYRVVGVRAIALYWYVIAALEVAVVATQVSPA
jgi:cytochrome c oxidase subunit 3